MFYIALCPLCACMGVRVCVLGGYSQLTATHVISLMLPVLNEFGHEHYTASLIIGTMIIWEKSHCIDNSLFHILHSHLVDTSDLLRLNSIAKKKHTLNQQSSNDY